MSMWVIWSEEHGAWWGHAGWGYVNSLAKAGRYTEAEAAKIMRDANIGMSLPQFRELAIPDPLAIFNRVAEERAGNPNLQTPNSGL